MTNRVTAACLTLAMLLHVGPARGAAMDIADEPSWRVDVGGGLLLFSPNVERIPRGESENAIDPLLEIGVAKRLSRRLDARVAFTHATGTDSEWRSEDGRGTAVIPTPSVTGLFTSIEAPLLVGTGAVVPHAGVGVGLVAFTEVDESIRFDWGTHVTNNRIRFGAHTDVSLLFELGARVRVTEKVELVSRYRLVSAFDDEQVSSVDHVTVSGRLRW